MKGKLAEYVVRNNPQGASLLLTQTYGMKPTRSMAQMVQQMNYVILTYREDALRNISEIHPDRELMHRPKPQVMEAVVEEVSNCSGCDKIKEEKSNACGCGSATSSASGGGCSCGGSCGGHSNANGDTTTPTQTTSTPPSNDSNVGKIITYLSVGVVAGIIAGIVFKSY